jgi:hypothetical protein
MKVLCPAAWPLTDRAPRAAVGMLDGNLVAVEINDSHHAHGDVDGEAGCSLCRAGVYSQCPARSAAARHACQPPPAR